jgi:hypothetical protein
LRLAKSDFLDSKVRRGATERFYKFPVGPRLIIKNYNKLFSEKWTGIDKFLRILAVEILFKPIG